jgi:8-oxo-dGTP pyrophosphatase MutT (NUDIX family)
VGGIDSVIDRLIDEAIVPAELMRGCSESDINEIMADQEVSHLPSAYLRYLRRIGRGAGHLLAGTDAFFPKIIGLKAAARELLNESGLVAEIGPEAFVIGMHQGYQVFWFPSVIDDDPEVVMFQEGDENVSRKWENFQAYLNDMIRQIDRR